jgi:hypothetical protein
MPNLVKAWVRRPYQIKMHDPSGVIEVDGIVCADAPSLGVHLGISHDVDVTHIPTGARIAHFETLGGALEFVARIASLRDWATLRGELPEAEVKAVREVLAYVASIERRPRRISGAVDLVTMEEPHDRS